MGSLRTIVVVASFDFLESLRSRKAIALLVLYLAGALAATGIFVRVLRAVESAAADALRVAKTESAGAMTSELFRNERFLEVLTELIGDRELATVLSSMPPLALFYAWLALTFIPLLVTLTAGDSIAYEVSTGSCRFALFRTDRLSWAIGKLAGQAMLMTVGIAVGALGAFALGLAYLADVQPGPTALWLARYSVRAWFYGFAYLGLAMGASQLTRSVNVARGLALLALFGVGLGGNVLESWDRVPDVLAGMVVLFPQGHDLDLWRPALLDRLPALAMLSALGILYFAAGAVRFARRDQ